MLNVNTETRKQFIFGFVSSRQIAVFGSFLWYPTVFMNMMNMMNALIATVCKNNNVRVNPTKSAPPQRKVMFASFAKCYGQYALIVQINKDLRFHRVSFLLSGVPLLLFFADVQFLALSHQRRQRKLCYLDVALPVSRAV